MKRILFGATLVMFTILSLSAQSAKYIFYFIGDGMGTNAVEATRQYMAYKGETMSMTTMPVFTTVRTSSANYAITDSSAGGTALATGTKTNNGMVGVNPEKEPLTSIAYQLKDKKYQVGIITSVSIDHATPASFYAREDSRGSYYNIAMQMGQTNFDFFGGGGVIQSINKRDSTMQSVPENLKQYGYSVCYGKDEYAKNKDAQKVVFMNRRDADNNSLKYAIDRDENDLELATIVQSCIEKFEANKRPFFIMVEGGKIDWAAHANDAATVIKETRDLDKSIAIALEFYKRYPKETLIVLTADHDTGGFALSAGKGINFNYKSIDLQKTSLQELTKRFNNMLKLRRIFTWEDIKDELTEQTGLFGEIAVSEDEEKALKAIFEKVFINREDKAVQTLYSKDNPLAVAAIKLVNDKANFAFTTKGHSASPVPLFAIGKGANKFVGILDNTDVPKLIMKK